MNDIIEARENYLANNPFDPFKEVIFTKDEHGILSGAIRVPSEADLAVIATKLGFDFMGSCRDGESLKQWMTTVMELSGSRDNMLIMFGKIFSTLQFIVTNLAEESPKLDEHLKRAALNVWVKDTKNEQ